MKYGILRNLVSRVVFSAHIVRFHAVTAVSIPICLSFIQFVACSEMSVE